MNDPLYRRLHDSRVEYKLTVLILSLSNRLDKLKILMKDLNQQTINKPVQVKYNGDNKSLSVGEKRNEALAFAKGRYVCFVDDDDTLAPDYIDSILEAIEHNPEVITFNFLKREPGREAEYRYYLDNGPQRMSPDRTHYKMNPNHLCVWRKDIINEEFPNRNKSEDHLWAENMRKHYSSIHNIDRILYFYNYDKELSETH